MLAGLGCWRTSFQALLDGVEKFLEDGGAIQESGILGVLEFGVPLDGESVGGGVGAPVSLGDQSNGLDHLIFGATGFDAEILAEGAQPLVVDGIDARARDIGIHRGQRGFWDQRKVVMEAVVEGGVSVDACAFELRFDILIECSTQRDVKELRAATDAKDGLVECDGCVNKGDLVVVAVKIAAPFGAKRFFAVARRRKIGAALEQETIKTVE